MELRPAFRAGRALFRKLSIFAGGFTLDAASAVASDSTIDEIGVLDLLSSLVDKSLVHVEPAGSGTRYRLLQSTRQYAREKLNACGELTAVARAHAAAYLALAEDLERAYETTPDRVWLDRVEPELENWRAAMEWTLAEGDVATSQRLAGALRREWWELAAAEGRRWVRVALETVDAATPDTVVAKLDLAEALLDGALSQYKASYGAAQRALTRYRSLPEPFYTTEAQQLAGRALILLGRELEGQAVLTEALAAARTLGARKLRVGCCANSLSRIRLRMTFPARVNALLKR